MESRRPESPMKLENLLQVPLQVIKLEDLLREKEKALGISSSQGESGDGRGCQSAPAAPAQLDRESLTKTLSAPCLFDCCAHPSRWKDTNVFSNKAKFKTTAIKLPDENGCLKEFVVPVMAIDEDTLTDDEMPKDEGDRQLEWSEKEQETGRRTQFGTVAGPITYEELVLAQARKVSSNNNLLGKESGGVGGKGTTEVSDVDTLKLTFYNEGRKESVKEFQTGGASGGGSSSVTDSSASLGLDVNSSAAGVDIRYFENPQGLQLARVLRENSEREKSAFVRNTTAYDNNNTQLERGGNAAAANSNLSSSSSLAQTRTLSSSISKLTRDRENNNKSSSERAWEQWDGLQISRCQRDDENKSPSAAANASSSSASPQQQQQQQNSKRLESEKGEAEKLIERHLQSYLTSMRYVKPTGSGEDNNPRRSPGVVVAPLDHSGENERMSSAKRSVGAATSLSSSSPEVINKSISVPPPINLSKSQGAAQVGGIMPSTFAQPRTAAAPETGLMASAGEVNKVATRIVPVNAHQISPLHQQLQQPTRRSTSPVDLWPEKAIARIPTRPYLRKSITYEQPPPPSLPPQNSQQKQHQHQGFPPQQQQQHRQQHESLEAQGFHSPPKRFKTTSLPTNPLLSKQQHGYIPGGNNVGTPPRSSYSNIQPQQHQQQYLYGSHSSSSGAAANMTNIRSPHRSPQIPPPAAVAHFKYPSSQNPPNYTAQQQQQQQHQHQQQQQQQQTQQQFNESIMLAAATAASNSAQDGFDKSTYYDRLRRYWEFYQRQEVDWTKLSEYYQKYNFYPWDILSARDETLLKHWKSQQSHSQQLGGSSSSSGRLIDLDMTQQQQHQLALKAMNVANLNKGIVSSGSYGSQHGRIESMNFSPPRGSPPTATQKEVQSHYNYNSQQLQQLQMQHHHQQQQQRNQNFIQHQQYQQQQRINSSEQQSSSRGYQIHPPQHSPKVGGGTTPQDIQNTAQYRNAYNQLAAAARAVASAAVLTTPRENHSRGSSTHGITAIPIHNRSSSDEREYSSLIVTPSTIPVQNEGGIHHPNNIHRQTLEHALKNNFRSAGGGSSTTTSNYGISNGGRVITRVPTAAGMPLSPPHQSHHHQQQLQQVQHSLGWPATLNSSGAGGGALNMSKEPFSSASSPTLVQQTSVIRRLQQDLPSPPSGNIVIRKSFVPFNNGKSGSPPENDSISYHQQQRRRPSMDDNMGGGGVQMQMQGIPLHHQHQLQKYANPAVDSRRLITAQVNKEGAYEMEQNSGIIKRRIIGVSEVGVGGGGGGGREKIHFDRRPLTATSPVPLIAGEEEIVTTNVSPSAVNGIDEEATLDGNELVDDSMNNDGRGEGNNNNGAWQYDHVVLLDKRIKTYMCKRCFETLKTEQQIRNHLFCKMLQNHVQCHVCLNVHGVRPHSMESTEGAQEPGDDGVIVRIEDP